MSGSRARDAAPGSDRPAQLLETRAELALRPRLRLRRRRHDARPAPVLAEPLVEHGAVAEGEEREVAPHADVRPRVHARAALADEDVAGAHGGAGEDLDAAPLPGAVAPVAGAALTLLVRHR